MSKRIPALGVASALAVVAAVADPFCWLEDLDSAPGQYVGESGETAHVEIFGKAAATDRCVPATAYTLEGNDPVQ